MVQRADELAALARPVGTAVNDSAAASIRVRFLVDHSSLVDWLD